LNDYELLFTAFHAALGAFSIAGILFLYLGYYDDEELSVVSQSVMVERVFQAPTTILRREMVPGDYFHNLDPRYEQRQMDALMDSMLKDIKPFITITEQAPKWDNPYAQPLRAEIGVVKLEALH